MTTPFKSFFSLVIALIALGACAQKNYNYDALRPEKFRDSITTQQVQLVDVRTPKEYAEQHIADAINIDFFDDENFEAAFKKLDNNKPVYIYCRSGNRSYKASIKLAELGFKQVYDLHGGILAWNKSFQKEP
ncbi:MAG: rhodanese-like domain-containing protein [Flavobacteriaceae bacterium]|nr:rhodanese-like domain-containing protein [Flavobacteriaceae bacterium]